jgi:hypothetical protein
MEGKKEMSAAIGKKTNVSAATAESTESLQVRKPEEVVYDADAEQRLQFQTERKGKMYTVTHIFGPLKDEDVLEYQRQISQRIGDAEADEVDEQDATVITSKGFQAAVNFWNTRGARAEGYAGTVSNRDKAYAVGTLLFGVEFESLPLASADELCPEDDDGASTYVLRCLFDSRECYTSATLRPPTNDEIEEFESLQSRALIVRGTRFGQRDQRIPAKAKRLSELFDLMKFSVQGYTRRVPLHHKVAFALRHLRSEQKAITGN